VLRTPLYPLIQPHARMTDFAGWEMPIQFSGITQEHHTVRNQAGMFDISHMGKFHLQGHNLVAQLQTLVPSDLSRLEPGRAQYTVFLTPTAGIVDDLIFYYQGQDASGLQKGVMIVNAATTDKDRQWILDHLDATQIQLDDVSSQYALVAVQGPQAVALLQTFVAEDLSGIAAFGHLQGTVLGHPAFLARTGYTGEDGFEVMLEPAAASDLWQKLLSLGVTPCGLGCRDTLRLEAAMALYGQDINEETTPLEAGLGWLVHLDTESDFLGRSILERQKLDGVEKRLIGFQMQGRNIARHDYPILYQSVQMGFVTSGTLSPTLGYPIALAYVPVALSKPGQLLDVEVRGKCYPATVVKRPFYRRNT
jgi:aminomethyltransferase